MPYKRYYKKRNKKCPRPMFGKADKYVAHKALWLGRKALKMLNVEYKFHDVQLTGSAISTTATILQLTNISQGDTGQTRDGLQLKVASILLRIRASVNESATKSSLRCILVHDKQTNGAIYTTAAILRDVTITDAIVSPYELDNKFRFRILYDKVVNLVPSNDSAIQMIDYYKRDVEMRIRYSGNAGDITDIPSSSLSLLLISTEATNTPSVTAFVRIRFVDN